MAYQSVLSAVRFGFDPPTPAISSAALSANNRYAAFAFTAQAATALASLRFYISGALGGTGGTLTCKLYADSGNAPNLGAGALDTLTVGSLTGNAFNNATGGTYSLTRGTRYWIVLNNADASPGTNSCSIAYFGALNNSEPTINDQAATSINGGSSWSYGGGCCRFGFADGNYLGFPASSFGLIAFANGVFGSQVAGTRFTTPANGKMVVAGLSGLWSTFGTPAGNLNLNLYDASHNLLASTYPVPNSTAKVQTNTWTQLLFNPSSISGGGSTITLSPGAAYTVGYADSAGNSDNSTNLFRPYVAALDTDANSLNLIPWGMQLDLYSGSWSQTQGQFCPFALLLATGSEFAASGGSGGTSVLRSGILQGLGAL
ncbi:MAG TPA: choice-of-anchor R domain-containing protein [Pirellulales bacterium]|nr:choice-of-anchor R domain-containing protein [Pirellulales bacterium]